MLASADFTGPLSLAVVKLSPPFCLGRSQELQSGAYSINAFYIAKTLVTVPYQVGRFVGKKVCSLFGSPPPSMYQGGGMEVVLQGLCMR